jgi:hypothetical protein
MTETMRENRHETDEPWIEVEQGAELVLVPFSPAVPVWPPPSPPSRGGFRGGVELPDDYGPQPGEEVRFAFWPAYTPGRRRRAGFGNRRRTAVPVPDGLIQPRRRRPGRKRRRANGGFDLHTRLEALRLAYGGRPPDHLVVWECSRFAVEDLLPIGLRRARLRGGLSVGAMAVLHEEALVRLRAVGACESMTDDERLTAVRKAVGTVRGSYDLRRVRDELWYGKADEAAARTFVRRLVGRQRARALTAAGGALGYRVNRRQLDNALAVVWVAAAKSVLRNKDRSVPVKWLSTALESYGYIDPHDKLRKWASTLLKALTDLRQFACTDPAFARHKARRFALCGLTYRIPFVAARQAAIERHARTRHRAAAVLPGRLVPRSAATDVARETNEGAGSGTGRVYGLENPSPLLPPLTFPPTTSFGGADLADPSSFFTFWH